MEDSKRKKTSLWLLGLSPLVWSHHFIITYGMAAIWCAKFGGDLSKVHWIVALVTLLSLMIVGREIYTGYQKHRSGGESPPHNEATAEDRERFLGFARLLISGLSLLAIIYTTYAAFVFRSCVK